MSSDTLFLTPKEVAEILGVHPKTVHLWLRTGKLVGTKISYRAWRIPQSALATFVAQNSNNSQKKPIVTSTGIPEISSKSGSLDKSLNASDVEQTSSLKMKYYIRDIMGEDGIPHNENGIYTDNNDNK